MEMIKMKKKWRWKNSKEIMKKEKIKNKKCRRKNEKIKKMKIKKIKQKKYYTEKKTPKIMTLPNPQRIAEKEKKKKKTKKRREHKKIKKNFFFHFYRKWKIKKMTKDIKEEEKRICIKKNKLKNPKSWPFQPHQTMKNHRK